MSRWLYRANWFAAYARDTLAAAKAWPLWRPSGIAKRCLKELLFEDAHHVECHWFGKRPPQAGNHRSKSRRGSHASPYFPF
jgi:hypothetical protein